MWMPVGQAIGVRPNVLSSQTIPNTLDGVGPRARAPRSRRIPEALKMLRDHEREVGLHGNDRDRRGAESNGIPTAPAATNTGSLCSRSAENWQ